MRRVRAWRAAAVLVLVIGAVVFVRSQCRFKTGDVAIPPADADAKAVVTAYVAALDKHDLSTAKALSDSQMVEKTESTSDSWYRNTRSITDLEVREPIPNTPGSGETRAGERESVFVPVSFDLDQCDAQSMPDGETGWGYLLARTSPTDRWLVVDEGPF